MDPYHALGLSKDCTRDELKEAFRTRARSAHPDRGGEPAAFIQLRRAYDEITKELGRRPPGPTDERSRRPTRDDPRPKQADPDWEPDLIVLDDEPIRTRPPTSPDPNWEPDLILLDDEPHQARVPESADPIWEPDLILRDDEAFHVRFPEPLDPRVARQNYLGWLAHLSARSQHEDANSDESWLRISRAAVLMAVIILTVWICWAAWSYEPSRDALELTPRLQGVRP
jgi:curved DNA-binding protein CbpA